MAATSDDEKEFFAISKIGKGSDQHCCVPSCNSNGRRHQVSFHRFPQAGARRNSWIQAIRRDPGPLFNINASTFVCSLHFTKEDFKWTPVRKTLTADAVPTVFSWTRDFTPRKAHFKHITPNKKTKLQSEHEMMDSISEEVNQEEDIEESEENLGDTSGVVAENIEKELERKLKERDEEIKQLKEKLRIERFGVCRFSNDNSMIMFFTGFSTYTLFLAFFNYIQPAANSMTSYYYKATDTVNLSVSRQRTMVLIDELLMFLCRLKCGLFEQDLACRFNVHVSTVSRKLITWSNFLYFVLGSINIWPTRNQIQNKMPQVFKTLYPTTRVIIDCTEIPTERPSSLALNSKFYSTYKSTHTFKSLVGIAPHGALIFISSLYTGSMSDVEITKLCGLVELLEEGDSIMADKGFVLNNVLSGTGITVNTPPFLMNKGQFTKQEVEETQTIARLRIHVERHIRRVKEFHLFDRPIPLSMIGSINQIWTVANILTLFRGPLVKQWQ